MNRLFGSGNKAPKPTLQSIISSHDGRVERFDTQIASYNNELAQYNDKLAKMREGPGKQAIKKRALEVLRKRRNVERLRDQQASQSYNLEQAQLMQDNLTGVMATVDALKTTNKALKKQYGKVDLDQIERGGFDHFMLKEIHEQIKMESRGPRLCLHSDQHHTKHQT